MGDLNFRLQENAYSFDEITRRVREGELADLLSKDQLNICRRYPASRIREKKHNRFICLYDLRNGEAFSELSEAPIKFPPTFKFTIGAEDEFDAKRRPAWPDRILSRCNSYNYENIDVLLELSCEVSN